ncbi:hypothetical protein Nepgr_009095 [Nepenthes gracilis]|uniref:PGG domain-containing protein n=1 Tax=Nepenthes gracilis TaxID=150966 RepID=A0AAD3SA92_NEPGR|nr:hypothetical protein Nepgr_009095 [Nepenthes gracilis]
MSTVAGGSTLQEILDRFLSKQEEWHKQQERNGRMESHRNAVMIAASLFAAAAFQAEVNPPGGFWQDTHPLPTAAEWFATEEKICTGILMVAMWIVIMAAASSFLNSTAATGSGSVTIYKTSPWVAYTFYAVFGIIFSGHIGRFLVKMVRRCWRKQRSSSSSTAAPANRSSV